MRLSSIATPVAVCVAAVSLTACAVSASEEAGCEQRGGSVQRDSFKMVEDPGFFGPSRSGPLYYCEDLSGSIIEVYNDKVEVLSDSWSLADYNKDIWNNCDRLGGETFKTSKKVGKSYSTRYVCVQDGRVVILKG